MSLLQFTSKGIYCPQGDFYIDPWEAVPYAIITHAHSDHARRGTQFYLCQKDSAPILKLRLGEDITVEGLNYKESRTINGVKVSMYPAGHIIGSAQIRLEYKGFISVVSGDYKIEDDTISTAFEPVKCNEFVTESTFGLPIYNWLSQNEIAYKMKQWIADNKAKEKSSVLIAYSLGKAQRLMKLLQDVAPLYVHYSIDKINQAMISNDIKLPHYNTLNESIDKTSLLNGIVIVPPSLLDTRVIKKIPNAAIAICSGWMQVRGRRRWQSADAGFAISDHADWTGLLSAIEASGSEKIWVTHGFTHIFSKYLNEQGYDAAPVITQYGEDSLNDIAIEE